MECLKPEENEVKVKVEYCGICGTDLHIFHGKMDQRVDIPQVIGYEMSGTRYRARRECQRFQSGRKGCCQTFGLVWKLSSM
ncbi:MAG: alcohol dehydrogenase catalytic domain-containing protein [Lentisphaeria bacterium]